MPKYTGKQARILHDHLMLESAKRWMAIGATVNDSFFDNRQSFSYEAMKEGLIQLGVDWDSIPKQTKWYEFWKDEASLKMEVAISMI